MLFDITDGNFESHKERNMYSKFFAGYFFNELVDGYLDRLKKFNELLCVKAEEHKIDISRKYGDIQLNAKNVHVSFDNHVNHAGHSENRGEFADIFIHDRPSRIAIPIEVKFFSDPSEKDLTDNLERIAYLKNLMPGTDFIPILLLRSNTLTNLKLHENQTGSFWIKYVNGYKNKIVVLTWEEIMGLCSVDAPAVKFMQKQLAKDSKAIYIVRDEGFFLGNPSPAPVQNTRGQAKSQKTHCPFLLCPVNPTGEYRLGMHLRAHLPSNEAKNLAGRVCNPPDGEQERGLCILDTAHGIILPADKITHLQGHGLNQAEAEHLVINYWSN